MASAYGRYGYRRITALLRREGWRVNHKRVERIWCQAGLKVPVKQKKRGRIWLNDGSCVRLRAEHVNHVWTYDFVHDKTSDGRDLKFLTAVDEYSRECLAIVTRRSLKSFDVLNALADLFLEKGLPQYIRSDNGPEFVAVELRKWLSNLRVSTLFIEPGRPWENGYIESFNGKFRDEYLAGELFDTLQGGTDIDGKVALALQFNQAAQFPWLPVTSARKFQPSALPPLWGLRAAV